MEANDSVTKSFLEKRRKGIGGTDISAIMGINPYKTSYEVYLEKVEGYKKDFSENDAIKRGLIFEKPTAELYEIETGKKLYSTGTIVNEKYPFLIANPDAIIPEEKRGVEIKTVGKYSVKDFGEQGTNTIPDHYYMQIAHYMFVMDYQYWDLAALFPNYELRIYSFERNKDFDDLILSEGESFWKNHVELKLPPDIDFKNPNVKQMIKSVYNKVEKSTIQLSDYLIIEADAMVQAKNQIKYWNKVHNDCEARILSAMGNSEIGELSNGDRFFRNVVKRKEYTVKASEYVRLDYKKSSGCSEED